MGKKSKSTTVQNIYKDTTTKNPYVTSHTNNSGTISTFMPNTAFNSINDFVNSNITTLLDEYLNPTLNSVTNQAKMNSYINALNSQTVKNLENNIINPLSKRNMMRSSQATNLYNNLASNNANSIGAFTNDLLVNSQAETAKILANLMLLYMNGYSAILDNQKQSLVTSQGNSSSSQTNGQSGMDYTDIMQMALKVAMSSSGL